MREKLETLPMTELREIAKVNNIKSVTAMRKSALIDKILEVTSEKEAKEPIKEVTKSEFENETLAERTYTPSQSRTYAKPEERKNMGKNSPENRLNDIKNNDIKNNDIKNSDIKNTETRTTDTKISENRTVTDESLDSGIIANGILEVMPDGYGFIRCDNYMPGDADVYVSPLQIKRLGLKTGDIIIGKVRVRTQNEKFAALLCVNTVNGYQISDVIKRKNFEDLTPVFPNKRLIMETDRHNMAMRILDIISPIGKGQRGMIVSPPKAGKTTLLKEMAQAITTNNPDIKMIILLIDERPEEVTDIKESIEGKNVEVIYSTFDELPEHHKRVSEMVIERAKRLVEHGEDVVILLDSITRLARAYNLTVAPSGRTLSGGLDPAALHMPKRFFGAARNMREGGSLTVLATALVDTGSKMDDVVFEEFKGTGNMEMVLDRKLSEKRVFPAIDLLKSGTRRDDLLLTPKELRAVEIIRKITNSMRADDAVETLLNLFDKTKNNEEFCEKIVNEFSGKIK